MLPKVKREIISSTVASISEENKAFLSKKLVEIKVNNPILFTILNTIADRKDWTDKEKNCYILGAVQFYMFLSMQDQCDQLQKDHPL